MRPKTPTISPRWSASEASWSPGAERPSTSKATSAEGPPSRRGKSSPTVRPTMSAISPSFVTDASGPEPTVLPSRSTVNDEATARVSSRKWLM
jgi:hypothetical protein